MGPEFGSRDQSPPPTRNRSFSESLYSFPTLPTSQSDQARQEAPSAGTSSQPPPDPDTTTRRRKSTSAASSRYKYMTPLTVPVLPPVPELSQAERAQYSLPGSTWASSASVGQAATSNQDAPFSHSQPRLRAPQKRKPNLYEEMDLLVPTIRAKFGSLGGFLRILFTDFRRRDGPAADKCSLPHRSLVAYFLRGKNKTKAVEIVQLMYAHRLSRPNYRSKQRDEVKAMFTERDPTSMQYARPAISCWALQIVGDYAHSAINTLTFDEEEDWEDVENTCQDVRLHARLASTSNPNAQRSDLRAKVDWARIIDPFSIQRIASTFERRAEGVWYLCRRMAAPEDANRVSIVRKRRPYSTILVTAISAFVMSRNKFANGYLAVPLGIWLWACRAHVDIKRALSRMGLSISDTTVRDALVSMSAAGQAKLQASVKDHASRGELGWRVIYDNVQGYALTREFGHGKQSTLIQGTMATAVRLYNCPPDAFKLQPYLDNLIDNKRSSLTANELLDHLNLPQVYKILALHWARALVEFIPSLQYLQPALLKLFRSAPYAINRLPFDTKCEIQPLSSNAEREITLQGAKACVYDFDKQMGWEEDWASFLISWYGGDGASYASLQRLKKLLAATAPGRYESLIHLLVTPELWHMGSTMVGTLATNHYGPASSSDPSSLSRASTAASQKRPTDLSKPVYYPTVAAMKLIWKAQVLDCWRLMYCPDNTLLEHFATLASQDKLPTLDSLIVDAGILQQRYGTLNAYEHALSEADWEHSKPSQQIPKGSPWTRSRPSVPVKVSADATAEDGSDEDDPEAAPGAVDEHEADASVHGEEEEHVLEEGKGEKIKEHIEESGFDGDRCVANACLYKFEMGLWIEFFTWILIFGGSTNTNYMLYLLEMFCLLTYDAPEPLRIAIFMNWLANFAAQLGHHIPLDLMQEHHNHVVEQLVEQTGKPFDDPLWREVASPNVHHVTRLKDEIEKGFGLSSRRNDHTSPDYVQELLSLLTLFSEEELHLFRSGRSLGHKAMNLLDKGFIRLDDGRLQEFLRDNTEWANFLRMSSESERSADSWGEDEDFTAAHLLAMMRDEMVFLDENGEMHETVLEENVEWMAAFVAATGAEDDEDDDEEEDTPLGQDGY
ncbi:hypothetical protein BDZ89DRAFT_1226378 [Hymenopellis radicata]|nr:hypothetical protein BDZ89DRAFT_1226378 [Hymenopellis radicata]